MVVSNRYQCWLTLQNWYLSGGSAAVQNVGEGYVLPLVQRCQGSSEAPDGNTCRGFSAEHGQIYSNYVSPNFIVTLLMMGISGRAHWGHSPATVLG